MLTSKHTSPLLSLFFVELKLNHLRWQLVLEVHRFPINCMAKSFLAEGKEE